MRRILTHVAFWVLYCMQDTLFAVSWIGSSLGPISRGRLYWMSLEDALLCLILKFIFAYFLIYRSIPKIFSGRYPTYRIITEAFIVLAGSLFLWRVQAYYIIDPLIYHKPYDSMLLTVKGFFQALMDIGFVTGIVVAIKLTRLQLAVKENEKHLIRDKLESELKFLRQQMSPHFLLNTLNNVYALARKQSPDTPEVVMKLSELLRFILYESGDACIQLVDEIKVLEDYLELERMRYDERLTVRFVRDLDGDCYRIVPLLLLPFIENAFKHGISESRFESYVYIDIRVVEGRLTYRVENSTDGVCHEEMSKKNIGLANVRRRLELTYKEYELEIRTEANSYHVNLSLNLESHVEI